MCRPRIWRIMAGVPTMSGGETVVPKYLWQIRYTPQGANGLLAEGGTGRRETVRQLLERHGGSLEAFYYAFGSTDLYVIGELPDEVTAAAISLRTAVTGAVQSHTVVLLTPEQIDEAARRDVEYRAPGA